MSGINEPNDEQNRIRSYLLGQLTDDERQLVEERIFTDPAFFADVQMTEEELLEDYVFKILPPEEAERFASRLLVNSEQIRRYEATAALKKYSDEDAKRRISPFFRQMRSGWRLAVAATVIVAIVIGIWMRRATSVEREVAALNVAGKSSETGSDYRVELPRLRLRSEPTEDVPEQPVAFPIQNNIVQLRLPLEAASYRSYEVTLIREPDSTLFTLSDHAPVESGNNKLLIVRVPAHALTQGEYRLILKGSTADGRIEDLGSHTFTVLAPAGK